MDLPLTVIILTMNEAVNLYRCINAIPKGVETIVVDSGSTDGTQDVAVRLGARLLAHPFTSFGQQRNWALDSANATHPWVLFLDADEEATPAFWNAIKSAIADDRESRLAGGFCCWKLLLRGRWLKRSDSFPKWQLRLVRRGRLRFVDVGHGQKEGEMDGEAFYIREPYLHHAFSKGWNDWLSRHNRYSDQEAVSRMEARDLSWFRALRASGSERNKLLKPLASRLPLWPLLRFLHGYLIKGGFMEGREGLDYSLLTAIYEYLICLKMHELERAVAVDALRPPSQV